MAGAPSRPAKIARNTGVIKPIHKFPDGFKASFYRGLTRGVYTYPCRTHVKHMSVYVKCVCSGYAMRVKAYVNPVLTFT